ncbi:hypothetical protein AVEN_265578-1 [Araneus ventricosus]|uniref:Uncharacterized protein n=1 Tax=Araneus ventricosus TaxID=182803 RepID=A0A4Y2VXZ0_ARAVE|nr:hypothetical protein AVEN_265578-1 [Araneus ventricosus]
MENEGLFKNVQEKHVAQVTGTIPLIQISNTNSQQFTSNHSNGTFNSAELTGFPARTADETPKSFQSINTPLGSKLGPFILSLIGRDITWNHLVHSNVSPLLIQISRKGLHILESSICRQNGRQGQGSRPDRFQSFHTYPCETLFPTIRLERQESDIAFL